MHKELQILLKIQERDRAILELELLAKKIPEKIQALQLELEKYRQDLEFLRSDFEKKVKNRRLKELELAAKEEEISRYQNRLYQIKTNKEYSALLHEIGLAKADKSQLEEEIIIALDGEDNLSKIISQKKEALNKEEDTLHQEEKKGQELLNQIKGKLNQVTEERKELVTKISKELLEDYEKIWRRKRDWAVVKLINGICQGCFMTLPPQMVIEVKKDNSFIHCENCARIIYIED